MMTMNYGNEAAELLLMTPVVELELDPIYREIPAFRPHRSAADKRVAAIMLEKLKRGDDLENELPAICNANFTINAVIEKLIDQLV